MTSLPPRADVVIVGGGLAGAATAYELTRAGITDVVLVEREPTCGHHASGRNAALCRQLAEDESNTDLTVRGAEFLRSPPEGFSSEPLLRATGSVFTAATPAELDRLAERAAAREIGHERLDPSQVTTHWPRLQGVECAGAVFIAGDGVVDIRALLHGFLDGARGRGVRILLDCEVVGFEVPGAAAADDVDDAPPPGVIVRTSMGSIAARCVAVAAGAWSGKVGAEAGASGVPFATLQSHLLLTEPVPEIDSEAPLCWHLGEDELCARPEGDGYLLCVCDEIEVEPAEATALPDAVAKATDKLARVAPRFAELGVARSWPCLRTVAPQRRPVITWDRDLDWLFWVAGLGRHGVTACAAVGEIAATRIAARIATRYA
jgi:glycine/D-amino acid oxidase-like deaminating enzyme